MKKAHLLQYMEVMKPTKDLEENYRKEEKLLYAYRGVTFQPYYGKLLQAKELIVDGERILQIDIWTHGKMERQDCLDYPTYTLFCNREKQEYITYDHEDERWRTAKIDYLDGIGAWRSYTSKRTSKLLLEYFGESNKLGYQTIIDFQREVLHDALLRRYKKETDQIDEVMETIPELPENFTWWVEETGMEESRYIYYTYSRNVKTGYCTHCRQDVEITKPHHNHSGVCSKCHSKIIFKSIKKAAVVKDVQKIELIQQTLTGDYVIREFDALKFYDDYKNPEIQISEIQRTIYSSNLCQGRRYYFGEYKHTHQLRWCNYDSYDGYYNIHRGRPYTENLKEIFQQTELHYMGLDQYFKNTNERHLSMMHVIQSCLYYRRPIEMLIKGGFYSLAGELMKGYRTSVADIGINVNGRNLKELLDCTMEDVRFLRSCDGDSDMLRIIQKKNEMQETLEHKTRKKNQLLSYPEALELRTYTNGWKFISYLEYTTAHKLLKYLAGMEKGSGLFITYLDYLNMRKELGYDLHNLIYLFPKNLEEKHNEMVHMRDERMAAERRKEAGRKFPSIAEQFPELNAIFNYTKNGYTIRPAQSAEEIVDEGKILHHCVGGNNYLEKHNEKKTFILMLRKNETLKTPYITVEVSNTGTLIQWYGAYDKKPDEKHMNAWIGRYIKQLKKKLERRQQEMKIQVAI